MIDTISKSEDFRKPQNNNYKSNTVDTEDRINLIKSN